MVTAESIYSNFRLAALDSYLRYLSCLLFNGVYRSVRLQDDEALLACGAHIELNPML